MAGAIVSGGVPATTVAQAYRPPTSPADSPYAGGNFQTANIYNNSDVDTPAPVPDTPAPAPVVSSAPAIAGAGRVGTNTSGNGSADPAMAGLQAAAPGTTTSDLPSADDLLSGPSVLRSGIGNRQSSFQTNSLAAQGLRNAY